MEEIVAQIKYQPRRQFMPFHSRTQRFACMVAHRRAGKTVACVNELISQAIYFRKRNREGEFLKRPRYAYIAPLLKQGKKIAWEYLKEYTAGLEKKKPSESDLSVTLRHNDAEITIYGADNPDGFRGQYFDGVVLDEYGDMSPSLWGSVILPTLSDRIGWAAFIGTFKGRNHFYNVYRRSQGLDLRPGDDPDDMRRKWFNYMLDIDRSDILSEEEKRLQKSEMDEEQWEQEFRCNPDAVVKGTYYMKMIVELERAGQIYNEVEWDPDQPVFVSSDLGFSDSTAFWFWQRRPDGLAIIDYLENHGQNLDYYFEELSGRRPYRYDTIWLPHDARAKTLGTRRTVVEQFLDKGYPVRIAPRLDVDDGIAAVRKMLPKCYFNARTEAGVECLRAYSRIYDEDKKAFANKPDHNWASHGADAFRYLALVAQDIPTGRLEEKKIIVPTPKLQLQILFEERERRMSRLRGRI